LYSFHNTTFENNAILAAIVPVLFWLLFSGRVVGFKAFGLELKTAIKTTSNKRITLTSIDFDEAAMGAKEEVEKISLYKEQKLVALSFELFKKNYYSSVVMRQYLDELITNGYLKWVVFNDASGLFQGLLLKKHCEIMRRCWVTMGTA
jgi:hypothetical protein